MKLLSGWQRSAAASLRLLGALTLCCTLPLLAAGPAWWTERGVLIPTQPANDFAAINQGQLKSFALAAFEELQAKLPPPGAGPAVTTLINGWTELDANSHRVAKPSATTADFAAVNLGQLKAVAKPFYDRIKEVIPSTVYPWTDATTDDTDYALVNIGQLKRAFIFSIHVPYDGDGDGMSDEYEIPNNLDPLVANGTLDADGDGVPNREDARPGNSAVGRLSINITAPANGVVLP